MSDYLTTGEAAALLRHSPATLRSWRRRGTGPKYTQPIGERGNVLYPRADLMAWLEGSTK
jgi:DNA-binding transcriptional MerR regulator